MTSIKEQAINVFKGWLNEAEDKTEDNDYYIRFDWIYARAMFKIVLEKYPFYIFGDKNQRSIETTFDCNWWECDENYNTDLANDKEIDFKQENLLCEFDIAINHKGTIKYAFIIDTEIPDFEFENEYFIRKVLNRTKGDYCIEDDNDNNQYCLYFLNANWILEQKQKPEKIPKIYLFQNIFF